MSQNIIRKIAVIFVTDVVGFSKMMERNEDDTLRSFRVCVEILENLFAEHGGRIFNTAGDSVLAEFQSAVSAVVCSSDFQRLIQERNNSLPDEDRMMFRIGINMGDVIVEGENLYGDGVNVASRLEALSQPGGVCLSKSIHDFVSQKVDLNFSDLGDQRVKNTQVRAYDVLLDSASARGSKVKRNVPREQTTKSRVPKIAVLPFINQSNDTDQDYFADGISEDIILNLSSWKTFPVIASNSSFAFRDSRQTASDIAEKLGADYLVSGSVRRGGKKVRITANLISAESDEQVWSQRWDRQLDDIFEVQDEVSQAIVALLGSAVTGQEQKRLVQRKKTTNLSAWDLYLKALSVQNNKGSGEQVIASCKAAIELDNQFCDAYVLWCRTLTGMIFSHEYADSRAANESQFHINAQKAFDLDPNNPEAVIMLSRSYNIKRDYDKRIELAKRALDLNPHHPSCNMDYGLAISSFGRFDEALMHIFKAVEMDPASRGSYEGILPMIYMAMEDADNALKWINSANDISPHSRYQGWLAAVHAQNGDIDLARIHLQNFLEERTEIRSLKDYEKVVPTICKDYVMEGLEKAGLKNSA